MISKNFFFTFIIHRIYFSESIHIITEVVRLQFLLIAFISQQAFSHLLSRIYFTCTAFLEDSINVCWFLLKLTWAPPLSTPYDLSNNTPLDLSIKKDKKRDGDKQSRGEFFALPSELWLVNACLTELFSC